MRANVYNIPKHKTNFEIDKNAHDTAAAYIMDLQCNDFHHKP